MLTAKVGHHVTPFSGTALCQFTQLERRLRYQKDCALEPVLKCLQTSTPLLCKREAEHQQKNLHFVNKACSCTTSLVHTRKEAFQMQIILFPVTT